jgi:phage terminase small subunit
MADAPRPLTPLQQRFVEEYLLDLNATQAAIRAGYSAATADKKGPALVGHSRIAAAIGVAMQARSERTQITADRVLQELAVVGFSSVEHYRGGEGYHLDLATDAPPSAMRAVSSVKVRSRTQDDVTTHEVEYRLWDKVSALEKLGQASRHVHRQAAGERRRRGPSAGGVLA